MEIKIKKGFRGLKNSDAIVKGYQYADGVANNSFFPDQEIIDKGDDVRTASDDLKTALAQPVSSIRSNGIEVARKAWEKEVSALTNLEQMVVNDADVTDDEKINMVKSANREVARRGHGQKLKFTAKRGSRSGDVDFTAEVEDAVAHLYTWTDDLAEFTGKADPWVSASAKTTAEGVPTGNELAFFHKAVYTKKKWIGRDRFF
jgi:hypothetical protein